MGARTMQVASSPVAPVMLVGMVLFWQAPIGGSLIAGKTVTHPQLGTRVLWRSGEYFQAGAELWRIRDISETTALVGLVIIAGSFAFGLVLGALTGRTETKPNRFYQACSVGVMAVMLFTFAMIPVGVCLRATVDRWFDIRPLGEVHTP